MVLVAIGEVAPPRLAGGHRDGTGAEPSASRGASLACELDLRGAAPGPGGATALWWSCDERRWCWWRSGRWRRRGSPVGTEMAPALSQARAVERRWPASSTCGVRHLGRAALRRCGGAVTNVDGVGGDRGGGAAAARRWAPRWHRR